MDILTGTSGFSYQEWKGAFYPEKLPGSEMLRFYASRLRSVEINNTFYRMPGADMLAAWAEQVPEHFRFAVKASRRITHSKRLKDAADETRFLLSRLEALGAKLGAILFQLPPHLKKDLPRLRDFLALLPPATPAAFEFRDASWREDDVLAALQESNAAWCVADTDDQESAAIATASWGYLRLRRSAYPAEALAAWVRRLHGEPWTHAFVFFKHEDAGAGPRLAAELERLAASP